MMAVNEYENALWNQAVKFHGHVCPGVAVGFRASIYALKLLDLTGNISESYYAVAENDVCGLDGVQIVTGCTIGNDSLIIDNQGKKAFSFVHKKTGDGIRVLLKVPLWGDYNEAVELHHKVKKGETTSQEKERFFTLRGKRGLELLDYPDKALFSFSKINLKIPSKPRLHNFVTCAICQEPTMLPWIKRKDDLEVCSKCFDS